MARITRRPQAAADILDIWDFIADDSFLEADRSAPKALTPKGAARHMDHTHTHDHDGLGSHTHGPGGHHHHT